MFPAACLGCRAENAGYLCSECREGFELRCSRLSGHTLWTLGSYEGLLKKSITSVKTQGHKALGKELAEIAGQIIAERIAPTFRPDFVMAVPASGQGQRFRGFSLPQMMEAQVVEKTGWQSLPPKLRRTFKSAKKSSRGLNKEARLARSKGLVQRTEEEADGALLILDDVVTTGATLSRCLEQAESMGYSDIRCFALAEHLPTS